MTVNKTDYFNYLLTCLSEPIYLTDKTDELKEEIKYNLWALAAPAEIIAQVTTADYVELIEKVKESHKVQLGKSQLNIDLIFYLWFDEMAGQLRFNFINSNHLVLPFGCKLKYANKPDEIVEQYLTSRYNTQTIPWEELRTIETAEEKAVASILEQEMQENYVLTVYREKIRKQK